jgi:glutaredoxin
MEWNKQIWTKYRLGDIFCCFECRKFSAGTKDIIDQMSIKIYSTSWCGPCKFAKRLLDGKGVSYDEIDIEKIGMSREEMASLTGGMSVPQIVINDEPIGGYEDLWTLDQNGELDQKLAD